MKMDSPVSYITWQKSILFKVAENIWFPALSKTYSLMGYYNHSIPACAKIMVSTNCPIIGALVAVNFVI